MAHFAGSQGSAQAAVAGVAGGAAGGPDMEWDLDVDAFLDDYLKELGPEAHRPDQFGNFSIDFNPSTTLQPGVLGAWGPSAPTPPAPADSTQQQAATMLTSQLQRQGMDSQAPASMLQRAASDAVQQPARVTRARKASGAAAAAAAAPSRATSGGSRGSRETGKDLDTKKHLALQEKNRRAQRRFRERQKQRVTELEEQVAILQAQLEAATAASATGPPGAAANSGVAAAGGALPGLQPEAARPVLPDGDIMQHDCKQEPHVSPRAVVGAQVPSTGSPPSDEDQPALAMAFEETLTLTVREGHPVQLTAQELGDMTPAELAKFYKAYVNELAGILVESDNPSSHTTQDRVRRLVDEVCLLVTRAALCNPPGSKHFALTKVDDVSNQPADTRVPQIARALDITQQQRRQLGQLRGLFLQKLALIAAERHEINQQLAGSVPGGTGNRHLASRYLASHDSARRLRESLREEHILVLDFVSTIYKHVFTAQQAAQFMIQSYPWTPDCLALCTWVGAEDGDAEALSMLAAEAQSKHQQQQQAAAAAAAAQAAGTAGGAPQASGGSGTSPQAAAPGSATAAAPGAVSMHGMPFMLPPAFTGMPAPGMFGPPMMAAGMMTAFNPAAALMHEPNGGGTDALNNMLGQHWGTGSGSAGMAPASSSGAQSSGLPLPLATGASGCLPIPLSLQHLAGAGSGKLGMQQGDFGCGQGLPISPLVAAMSSANDG